MTVKFSLKFKFYFEQKSEDIIRISLLTY